MRQMGLFTSSEPFEIRIPAKETPPGAQLTHFQSFNVSQ